MTPDSVALVGNRAPSMAVETLRGMLERDEPIVVLDVRPAAEHAEWQIPGSVHIDAYDRLKARDSEVLSGLDIHPGQRVVTICAAGKTSQIAAEILRSRGIDAASLEGGIKAWSLAWNVAELPLLDRTLNVVQVRRTGKGCLSYLIGRDGEAAVIDAAVDPQVYLQLARQRGWDIRHVLDTHVHADHFSRSRILAERADATLYLPAQDRVKHPFQPLVEGDEILIGRSRVQAVRTPGHTLEASCYLLDDLVLFTGDTLFVEGVGRPDLEANSEEARARGRLLYHSLHQLLALPGDTTILPGHTSSPVPFDGQVIGARLSSLRERIRFLRVNEETFLEETLARIPPTPPNYHTIVASNEAGTFPDGDPTDLEAGANRCAVT
jgi:glyoxylase-like metal-dependent hydrolase (beta-lactamase superfamily II)/rhodanese-related sulfurtransferase